MTGKLRRTWPQAGEGEKGPERKNVPGERNTRARVLCPIPDASVAREVVSEAGRDNVNCHVASWGKKLGFYSQPHPKPSEDFLCGLLINSSL